MDLPPLPEVPTDAPQQIIEQYEQETPLTKGCLARVVEHYEVHPVILSLVQRVEGGWTGAKVSNTDGSYDLGLMQINTIHLDQLSGNGITEGMVRNNDCINIAVAAWYLRQVTHGQSLDDDPRSFFKALARYHSFTPERVEVYSQMLEQSMDEIVAEFGGQP